MCEIDAYIYIYIVLIAFICCVMNIYIYRYSAVLFKRNMYISIDLMTDGKAFVIIIKVIEREFKK